MEEFEELLRKFRPRSPRPLPDVIRPRRSQWTVRVAVCGAAAVAVVVLAMASRHERAPAALSSASVITLRALNEHAMDIDDDLDAILTKTSRAILPDVQHAHGVLHALSKE